MPTITNDLLALTVREDGRVHRFTDLSTGTDYLAAPQAFAHARVGGAAVSATRVAADGHRLTVWFGHAGDATLRITPRPRYLLVEVLDVTGGQIDALTLGPWHLTLAGDPAEPFAACVLALNLQTHVPQLPMSGPVLQASCYRRFGFAGAQAALIGCPTEALRAAMQDAVAEAPGLPHSPLGGPWALDAPLARGSYLFNFTGLTEEAADEWIGLAQALGFTQIDFHGGQSFRFGDCAPNPALYPDGRDSLKRVVDKLHAAGLAAGLHTYAFFIDKASRWVAPVPDPRLGTFRTFTLAEPVSADAATLTVRESTAEMSTVTGFFVHNSITLRLGEELVNFSGVTPAPPYRFTGCTRGAHGTRPAAHAAGATAHHLKECFGLFCPDGDNTLLAEVAAASAETFNYCGFDMLYLDALDGEAILGGQDAAWHYGSKFVFELWQRLARPALMEMSTFHHHLWYVRSRLGAWDHPNRSTKPYLDIHVRDNAQHRRMFLPSHLGWWAVLPWNGLQVERSFTDEMDYLGAKAAGTDTGISLMGVQPETLRDTPNLRRMAEVLRRWETARHAGAFSAPVKAALRAPGAEFTLREDGRVCPAHYARHRVEGAWAAQWTMTNPFAAQPARLRIEVLESAAPADDPLAQVILSAAEMLDATDRRSAYGIDATWAPSEVRAEAACLTVRNGGADPTAAWTMLRRRLAPPLDLSARQALGLWVHGDGQGAVLNCQLRSPHAVSHAISEHYVLLDFTGWRWVDFLEPEGERYDRYGWPYFLPEAQWGTPEEAEARAAQPSMMGGYQIYRELVDYRQIETVSLWLNDVPRGGGVTCHLGPLTARPLRPGRLVNPVVTVHGVAVAFPVTLEQGEYLEWLDAGPAVIYGQDGVERARVTPQGAPMLAAGDNTVAFRNDHPLGRARVTVASWGEVL